MVNISHLYKIFYKICRSIFDKAMFLFLLNICFTNFAGLLSRFKFYQRYRTYFKNLKINVLIIGLYYMFIHSKIQVWTARLTGLVVYALQKVLGFAT